MVFQHQQQAEQVTLLQLVLLKVIQEELHLFHLKVVEEEVRVQQEVQVDLDLMQMVDQEEMVQQI
jgi:hypothetical protein